MLGLSLALIAARPPAPKPSAKPSPTPSPTSGPTAAPRLPLVVVYPFEYSSDLQRDTGTKAAQLYVAEMNAAGGVDALQGPITVKRANYGTYAKSLNASYYVSGYMTPLGGGVSLVEQVVDTTTGTIILGATAQIGSFEDAASQAVSIRDGIIEREQSRAQAFQEASAQATPAPLPSNQANIGAGLSGLFRHRGHQAATQAAIVKPDKGIFVMHVSGSAAAAQLTEATNALYAALNHNYNAHMTSVSGDAGRQADAICGTARNNTVATGKLSTQSVRRGPFNHTEYTFVFDVYTCFGAKLAETTAQGGSVGSAVSSAVAAYANDHPQNA